MDKPVSLEQGILKLLSVLNEQSFERMDNNKKINGRQGAKIPKLTFGTLSGNFHDILKHLHNKVSPEPLATEEFHCLRTPIYPIFSGNEQIHAGFFGMQIAGMYRVPNTCEQETTSPEENMASCIKSLANEKEEIEYLEKISANVYAQEANGFK